MNTIRADRLRMVMAHIEAHPEQWDQVDYHCGTSHCFVGWGEILAGRGLLRMGEHTSFAMKWFGLSNSQTTVLAYGFNTLADLHRIVDKLCALAEPVQADPPIREDRQLVRWEDCAWQPAKVTP
jgi:hypothetical protein